VIQTVTWLWMDRGQQEGKGIVAAVEGGLRDAAAGQFDSL